MSLHIITDQNILSLNYDYPHELPLKTRKNIIKNINNTIKPGDIIAFFNKIGIKNEGKSIYDGNDIISLYYEIDDEGSIPPIFFLSYEYPPLYWQQEVTVLKNGSVFYKQIQKVEHIYYGPLIAHNNIIWIDTKNTYIELRNNIKKIFGKSYVSHFQVENLGRYFIEITDIDNFIELLNNKLPISVETDLHYPDINVLYFPQYEDKYEEYYTYRYRIKSN